MEIETLVGLQVIEDEGYQSYRDAMKPILENYGGGFGYDFKVSEVLKSKTDAPINRVFTISFPDQGAKDAFFSNEEYLQIRRRYFRKISRPHHHHCLLPTLRDHGSPLLTPLFLCFFSRFI